MTLNSVFFLITARTNHSYYVGLHASLTPNWTVQTKVFIAATSRILRPDPARRLCLKRFRHSSRKAVALRIPLLMT